ncbi:hypothetical protein PIB30_027542 [Stylosanthes scabra]|uniref:Uncharacterized protein n=1 Tax=Stylosanthes scabra TaxID=79078 RepID=A0ABU6U9I8_9FABA|nr:hypothetical protein [Stylosanthes scabra]
MKRHPYNDDRCYHGMNVMSLKSCIAENPNRWFLRFPYCKCFNWSSRNLPLSEFPSVLLVQGFDSLILVASKMLHKEPNCVTVDLFHPNSGTTASVVAVESVHGQLDDLLFLLKNAGYPSDDLIFVFNGD